MSKKKIPHLLYLKCAKKCKSTTVIEDTMIGCSGFTDIVTKKPKWVTIKGWAEDNKSGWKFVEEGSGVYQYPAELRVKAKYLKGGK